MSLQPTTIEPVPALTARIARAAFPKGNPYRVLRDAFGILFQDALFAPLFPPRGRPVVAPWRLALVTIMQFAEDLSDLQAAEAVRSRIDWKYALSLELEDPGFDASVLCEFRARLLAGSAQQLFLDTLLAECRKRGLLKAGGKQRTDSTHVLGAVRALNRYELVVETMRATLDDLAVAAPDWLRAHAPAEWVDRYTRRADKERLPDKPEQRKALAEVVGRDGVGLLQALSDANTPPVLRHLPAVKVLGRVWIQNYQPTQQGWQWREADNIPPATCFLSSPYDTEAHLAKKGSTCWVGYKVHLTETCEDDLPSLITAVHTTAAPVADGEATPLVHQALKDKDLLPKTHIVDTGYLDAALLVSSQKDFGVDLLGPTRPDLRWQARAGQGFDVQHFRIDWEKQQARCPAGCTSLSWTPAIDNRVNEVIKIKFSMKDCRVCPSGNQCLRSQKKYARRTITVRPEGQYHALQTAREREQTDAYTTEYARRAGIEGTLSRGVRTCGMRRSRYIGMAKVHLGNLLTAVALNVLRLSEWVADKPRAKTRRSAFYRLMVATA